MQTAFAQAPAAAQIQRQFFTYTANALPLGASSTLAVDVPIDAGSHFLIISMSAVGVETDNTTFLTNIPALVTIKDTSSGADFMDRAVHIMNIAGTAQRPFYLPEPRRVLAGSSLSVTFTNQSAIARNVRLSFHGFKLSR